MRRSSPATPADVLAELRRVRREVDVTARDQLDRWGGDVPESHAPSVDNLAAYLALRQHDLRPLQRRLSYLGLSSLGRCEAHVRASLATVEDALGRLVGERHAAPDPDPLWGANVDAELRLGEATAALFGPAEEPRSRILVTLPSEAAADPTLVTRMVEAGVDSVRINCAHDTPGAWARMAEAARAAGERRGRACRVFMDLGGPKLRVGRFARAEPAMKVRGQRLGDGWGRSPALLVLDASGAPGAPAGRGADGAVAPARVAVDAGWVAGLEPGDRVGVDDARGRRRWLTVLGEERPGAVLASCDRSVVVATGARLVHRPAGGGARRAEVGPIEAGPVTIRLAVGDRFALTGPELPGRPARGDEPATVPCAQGDVLADLRVGERVFVDDGKLGAEIVATADDRAELVVRTAGPRGTVVREEKGINFPDSTLRLSSLTDKDRADLDHVVRLADVVGHSFVRGPGDVEELRAELAARGRSDLGVVAKIETQEAVERLPDILAAGSRQPAFGVMIARGDLAVEVGWEHLAEVQERILWVCEAAHVPVVWATQVLESLMKEGRPSRAELTDAAMADRAECVMLNKGPYSVETVAVLRRVLGRMQRYAEKKSDLLPPLE